MKLKTLSEIIDNNEPAAGLEIFYTYEEENAKQAVTLHTDPGCSMSVNRQHGWGTTTSMVKRFKNAYVSSCFFCCTSAQKPVMDRLCERLDTRLGKPPKGAWASVRAMMRMLWFETHKPTNWQTWVEWVEGQPPEALQEQARSLWRDTAEKPTGFRLVRTSVHVNKADQQLNARLASGEHLCRGAYLYGTLALPGVKAHSIQALIHCNIPRELTRNELLLVHEFNEETTAQQSWDVDGAEWAKRTRQNLQDAADTAMLCTA